MTVLPRARARTTINVRPRRFVAMLAAIASLATVAVATISLSLAMFQAQSNTPAVFGTKAVFPGERVTPAFQVGDSSSGTEVNRSSSFAFAADGLTTTTSAWSR